MNLFILKKLRKLFKSLGKYEYKILDKITLLENKKQNKIKNITLDDNKFLQIEKNLSNPLFEPKKISIVICFYYNKKKIKNLIKICENINNYRFSKDVSIITNNINNKRIVNILFVGNLIPKSTHHQLYKQKKPRMCGVSSYACTLLSITTFT